jgi:hypothetical protein
MQLSSPGSPILRPLVRVSPDTAAAPFHPEDVGPLLAQAAMLARAPALDDATRALLDDALRHALTAAASQPSA